MIFHLICFKVPDFLSEVYALQQKNKNKTKKQTKKQQHILRSMPIYIWGAGEQLYYFQGFGEHKQNNFREQRKIFSGIWEIWALFSGSKEALTPPPPQPGGLDNPPVCCEPVNSGGLPGTAGRPHLLNTTLFLPFRRFRLLYMHLFYSWRMGKLHHIARILKYFEGGNY